MKEITHDNPNVLYQLICKQVFQLASIGATDKECEKLLAKGPNITLKDLAKVELKHTRYVDPTAPDLTDAIAPEAYVRDGYVG